MIVIIDYGIGNLGSIQNMIKKVGFTSVISSDKEDILNASKLILSGVGSFDIAMKELDLIDAINKKIPILGICLGMQLLTKGSEEGHLSGYIDAYANKFYFEETKLLVPHMGWNILNIKKTTNLFKDESIEQRFYFVHSYAVKCR